MDRSTLEAELDIVLASLARVSINGAEQFAEKKRQFLMKVGDAVNAAPAAAAQALLQQAAKALATPASAARYAQSDLRERIEAHLAAADPSHQPAQGAAA